MFGQCDITVKEYYQLRILWVFDEYNDDDKDYGSIHIIIWEYAEKTQLFSISVPSNTDYRLP